MEKLRVRPSNIFKVKLGKGVVGLPVACCQDLVQGDATLKGLEAAKALTSCALTWCKVRAS